MSIIQQELHGLCLTSTLANKATKTFAFSKSFLKVMLMTSFVNIAYRRIDIDKSEISKKKFNDITFLGLKKGIPEDPRFKLLLDMRAGIYEAVEKSYLKEVYLHIMEKGEVVESYIFKIKYNTSNASIKSNTVEHKESIVSILELFLELGNHEKLSRQAKIEMELSYYDITPKTYEPPGFDAASDPFCLKIDNTFHKLGDLNTGFHSMKYYGIGQIFHQLFNEARSERTAICYETADANEIEIEPEAGETEPKRKKKCVSPKADFNKDVVQPVLEETEQRKDATLGDKTLDSIIFSNDESGDGTVKPIRQSLQDHKKALESIILSDNEDITRKLNAESTFGHVTVNLASSDDEVLSVQGKARKRKYKENSNINILANVTIDPGYATPGSLNITISDDEDFDDRSTEQLVTCICVLKHNLPDYIESFNCSKCKNTFHSACFGILDLDPSKEEKLYCYYCKPNDKLLDITPRDQHFWIGHLRLLTYSLYVKKTLDEDILNAIPDDVRAFSLKKLDTYGVVTIDKNGQRVYDAKSIRKAVTILFPVDEESQLLQI